jgi:glycosyltransferase involved in cell wall biosynthesis
LPRLSIVIPALNEYDNMEAVLSSIPSRALGELGWATEVIVVDNGSSDGTGDRARSLGALVIEQPVRGYGNAYRAGFSAASGDVIATGDADLTYPLDHLPQLLVEFQASGVDFMTTDRLHRANRVAMKPSHTVGNHLLSIAARALFGHGFRDSQSGMWIFRRQVWSTLDVRSGGMAFSQEIKNEAHARGFQSVEVPIEYRPRGGTVKLNAARDGFNNLRQLVEHRRRLRSTGSRNLVSALNVPAMPTLATLSGRLDSGPIDLRTVPGQ